MGNIIEFADWLVRDLHYREVLTDVQALMVDVHRQTLTAAMNLAVAGVWREWNDSVPDGTDVQISFESLGSCGDQSVEQLAAICELIRESGLIAAVDK